MIEQFQGKTVWEGPVAVFELQGHPKASIAYAWVSPVRQSTKQRYYAVLHDGPVESPEDAVRAAIASDYKGGVR